MKEIVPVIVWVASVSLTVEVSALIVQNKHVRLCTAPKIPISIL